LAVYCHIDLIALAEVDALYENVAPLHLVRERDVSDAESDAEAR
jgi:hypothetical protein